MNASLAAMQNAFLGGSGRGSTLVVTPVQKNRVRTSLLQQKTLMDLIQKQMQHLKTLYSEGGAMSEQVR